MFLASVIIVFSSMPELNVTSSKISYCRKHFGQENHALVVNAIETPML